MSKDKGGAAFPVLPPIIATDYPWPEAGMTLLDYFAGQALQGYIAAHSSAVEMEIYPPEEKEAAIRSYDFAVAMIAEKRRREK